jgi:hypothetical protein
VQSQAPMKKFLNSLQPVDWEARRNESGLLDWYDQIIALLMGKDETMCWLPHVQHLHNRESGNESHTENARFYAFHALSYRTDTRLACHIQEFQQLILVPYRAVLIKLNEPKTTVHDIMRIGISNTSSKNLDRYISGARLLNSWMDVLLRRGWGFRSWEVFLFCQSISKSNS